MFPLPLPEQIAPKAICETWPQAGQGSDRPKAEGATAACGLEQLSAAEGRGATVAHDRAIFNRTGIPLNEGLHGTQGFILSPLPLREGKGAPP